MIDQLTNELCDKCSGKPAAVVVAATMNLLMSTLQQVPDKNLLGASAATLREIANQLEEIGRGEPHH